jgi:hypothetical protein
MERGASPVLTAQGTRTGGTDTVAEGLLDDRRSRPRGGRLRRAFAGLADSCVLVAVALLGCLALVAVGTVASLVWMVIDQH